MRVASVKKVNGYPEFRETKCWHDSNLDPNIIDFDDKAVYENVYHKATTRNAGVFQLTSGGAQKLFERAKPGSITDIAALTSIYRPGPLAAGVDKIYVEAKANPHEIRYEHPLVKQVLQDTYSCLSGDSMITTDEGDIAIKDIVECNMVGLLLPSLNTETGDIEQDEIVAAKYNGIKETITLELENGSKIKLTSDHLVYTTRGWVEAGSLSLDDEIMGIE